MTDIERVRKILDERARRLALRRDEPASRLSGVQVLTFWVAGQKYAIDLARALLVIPARQIEAVPGAPPEIAGLLSVQGEAAIVLRTASLLGLSGAKAPDEDGYVVFVTRQSAASGPHKAAACRIGLWVERVGDVERGAYDEAPPKSDGSGAVSQRYVRSSSAEGYSHIEVDSIFNHHIFMES